MGRVINASFALSPSKRFDLDDRTFYKKIAKYLINYSYGRDFDLVSVSLKNKEISYPKSEIDRMAELSSSLAITMLSDILRDIDEGNDEILFQS